MAVWLAVFIVGIGIGCGGDSGSTHAPGRRFTSAHRSSLDKAEFLRRVDRICHAVRSKGARRLFAYFKRNGIRLGKAEIAPHATLIFHRFLGPVYKHEVAAIHALGAPHGDEKRVVTILNAIEEGIEKAKEDPVQYLYGSPGPFAGAYKLAVGYGLTKCATG
jgi:hypothetical protein